MPLPKIVAMLAVLDSGYAAVRISRDTAAHYGGYAAVFKSSYATVRNSGNGATP